MPQILMNYLSNAMKFTNKGEVMVKVTCKSKKHKEDDSVVRTKSLPFPLFLHLIDPPLFPLSPHSLVFT